MAKIDLEKWVCSMIEAFPDFKERGKIPSMYQQALKDQCLEYKDGKIVEINKCAECTNDKGCVTCENGDQFETTKKEYRK